MDADIEVLLGLDPKLISGSSFLALCASAFAQKKPPTKQRSDKSMTTKLTDYDSLAFQIPITIKHLYNISCYLRERANMCEIVAIEAEQKIDGNRTRDISRNRCTVLRKWANEIRLMYITMLRCELNIEDDQYSDLVIIDNWQLLGKPTAYNLYGNWDTSHGWAEPAV